MILVVKKVPQLNTLNILGAKVGEPLNQDDLVEYLSESIHFAQERGARSPRMIASMIVADMEQSNHKVIEDDN